MNIAASGRSIVVVHRSFLCSCFIKSILKYIYIIYWLTVQPSSIPSKTCRRWSIMIMIASRFNLSIDWGVDWAPKFPEYVFCAFVNKLASLPSYSEEGNLWALVITLIVRLDKLMVNQGQVIIAPAFDPEFRRATQACRSGARVILFTRGNE